MCKRTLSPRYIALAVAMGLVVGSAGITRAATLSGWVYEGDVGDTSKPIAGVTVELWGSNNQAVKGTIITTATTGFNGAYSLDASGAYEYFHIVEKDPATYSSVGATTSGGTKIDNNWIQYKIPLTGKILTGNNFWDKKPDQPPQNRPPVANPDSDSTNQDAPKNIDVLSNDSDPDDDPLSIESVSDPPHGTAARDGQTVFYMPDGGFVGTDSFTYTVRDGRGGTATATVTVTVNRVSPPENHPPVANPDSASTNQDTPKNIDVLSNDSDPDDDPLSIQSVSDPPHGTAVRDGQTVFYMPDGGFVGTDSFTYTVSDGKGGTATGTVTVTVIPVSPPEGYDYGDAPDPKYPTLRANNGAQHTLATRFYLGTKIDGEPDGQPHPQAMGDDNNGDDEDGVLFTSSLIAGSPYTVQVTVTAPVEGVLDAWVDFNRDGDWADPNEQIFTKLKVPQGVNNLTFMVPATANKGESFARFRLSEAGVSSYTGPGGPGEVEDYRVEIDVPPPQQWDFGDAPEGGKYKYPTTLANNGARHKITTTGPWLGYANDYPDAEHDGQPSSYALGDDYNGRSDENGVMYTRYYRGVPVDIEVIVSGGGGYVDVWIDFNGDGDWDEAGEKVHSNSLSDGNHHIIVTVPPDSIVGDTFARFRISKAGGLKPYGEAQDGEVEDYKVSILERDWGDAVNSDHYTANIVSIGGESLYLGSSIDGEVAPFYTDPNGLGDDKNGIDDEDGVVFKTPLVPGKQATVEVTIQHLAGLKEVVWLGGWIDFNRNSSFEISPDEEIISVSWPAPPTPGVYTYTFTVPPSAQLGYTFARFRIQEIQEYMKPGPRGIVPLLGEVEDYQVVIQESGQTGISISGIKFNDLDGDGQRDPGELGLPNWTIWLDDNDDGKRDKTTTTDASGNFSFSGLGAGKYTVGEDLQPGWTQTGLSTYTMTVLSGSLQVVFGNRRTDQAAEGYDFGDAPEGGNYKYPTTLASNGARHKIVQRFCLGTDVDGETDGIPSPDAKGDDHNNRNDEDGVLITSSLTPGTKANITVMVTAAAPVDCYLDAWVDFNCDGDWGDPNEQIFAGEKLTALSNALSFDVPVDANSGVSFARFRLSKNGGLSYDGEAQNGEVEDYLVEINPAGAQPPTPRPPMGHPKWSQPPVEIDRDGGIPIYSGWNEPSGEVEVASGIWFACWNCPTQCHGDADCDGDVDLYDFIKLQNAFSYKYGDKNYDACADFERDLDVDLDDFVILQQFFAGPNNPIQGQDCPGKPVFRQVLADDWLCKDERVVTDVHWWGSFIGWAERRLPPVYPKVFHIGIWTDVAVGQDPQNPFSHPGSLIWENLCDKWTWRFDGYDLDPRTKESEKEACFEFTQILSDGEYFKPGLDARGTAKVYWLSITPIYSLRASEVEYPWGWKTRTHFFNDDAVRVSQSGNMVQGQAYPLSPPALGAQWVNGEPITWGGESWDLAFELTSNVPDPEKPGRADLNWDGIVDFKDLSLLLRWWLTPDP